MIQREWNHLKNSLARGLVLPVLMLFSVNVFSKDVFIEPGESRLIEGTQEIDSVFISSEEVADYEVVGSNSVIIYAKTAGRADFIAMDKDGKRVIGATLVVDPVIGSLQKSINSIAPGADVSIEKVGNAYVLSGTVNTEEQRDRLYQLVGESLKATSETTHKTVVEPGDSKTSASQGNNNDWLNSVRYQGVINRLQIARANQVNVKLSVVDVTKTFTDNLGVDWSTLGATTGTFRFVRFSADTLSALVHAMSDDSVARVLAEPNLSVLSGETAEFLVGGEVPIITSSNNGTSVEYKEYGIRLNIGAKVSDNQRIRISLGEEVSNIANSYSSQAGDSFPSLQTRRARSTVEVADGESFVLGGLISNEERQQLSKIPLLGDVPILGGLFRYAQQDKNRRELVVVATVTLVHPVRTREVNMPDFQRKTLLSHFLNLDSLTDIHERNLAREFTQQGGFIR